MENLDEKKSKRQNKKKEANNDHKLISVMKFPEEEKKEQLGPKLILGGQVSNYE